MTLFAVNLQTLVVEDLLKLLKSCARFSELLVSHFMHSYSSTCLFLILFCRMMWNEGFYKVLLIGDCSVGKTGIQQRYVDDIFLNTISTIGMSVHVRMYA